MVNSLNPDQARDFVGPDLVPICFQRYKLMILVGKIVNLFKSISV